MRSGNQKGPNITNSKILMEQEYEHKNVKVTVKRIEVDNPANSPAPGKHKYVEIRSWYWNRGAEAWMPGKGVWLSYDNEEDSTILKGVGETLIAEVTK